MAAVLLGLHLPGSQTVEQAQPVAQQVARVALIGLLEQHPLGEAGVGAAAGHVLDRAGDDAGVLRREVAALEGGPGGRHRGQPACQADLGVGGAGADVEVVGEPGGAGQAHGQLACLLGLLGGRVHRADGARDGGVDPVALAEGDAQQLGQLGDGEPLVAGGAEGGDDLPGSGLDEFGELCSAREHVPTVGRRRPIANPPC